MGCDIHFSVEHLTENGWERAETVVPNPYYDKDDDSDYDQPFEHEDWYSGRNYDLFAMLADVRNGTGVAGIDTGEGFIPIAPPRGLPTDVSDDVKARSERMGIDGHSHSYFDLAEWFAYDITQTTKHRTLVTPEPGDFYVDAEHNRVEVPKDWPFGENGTANMMDARPTTRSDTPAHKIATEYAAYIQRRAEYEEPRGCAGVSGPGAAFYRVVEWESSYASSLYRFFTTIHRMAHLATTEHDGDLTAVRAVFFFDN